MKIGFDARFLTHPQPGGFKTYTKDLVTALAEVDTNNEYILYIDRPPDQDTPLPDRSNFAVRVVPGSLPVLGMPWREQISLPRQAARDELDLLHSPSLTAPLRLSCPSVVTIHDMIWFFPEKFPRRNKSSGKRRLMEWYYHSVPKFAARNASAVITVSHASKDSILEYLKLAPQRVFVTHEAASPVYHLVTDEKSKRALREKHNLSQKFILAIGSADPRKNLSTLIEAYALLPTFLRNHYQLVIIWTHSLLALELNERVKALALGDRVRFLEGISDQELVLLYNTSSLFVFPSLYEGFGLPPLEAMACGTPVVAADNSSIPEIVGNAALLTDAQSAQAIAGAMAQILADEALQIRLIKTGLERAASFSWEKCARETIQVYQKVLGL